jgi:hypothetical protein
MLPFDTERPNRAESFYRSNDALISELQQVTKALSAVLSRAAKANRTGTLRALSKQVVEAHRVAGDVITRARRLQDDTATFAATMNASSLLSEIVDEAKRLGLLDVHQRGDAILSFPTRMAVQGGLLRQYGKTVESTRPSIIASGLLAARVKAEQPSAGIIEAVFATYQLLVSARHDAIGDVVPITDVYAALTLMPAARDTYSETDLAFDLYSSIAAARNVTATGYSLSITGSTTTGPGRGHRMVARDGTEIVFSMVSFHKS